MKTRILSLVVALVLMLCAIPCAFAEESPVKDNTPFIGRWSLNVADYPGFAEEGLTQGTITMELKEDGTDGTKKIRNRAAAFQAFLNAHFPKNPPSPRRREPKGGAA